MGPRAFRRGGIAAVFAVVTAVALCAPAFAYSSRAAKTIVVPKLGKGAVAATCRSGQHVAFGGVVAEVKAPYGSGAQVFPTSARRTASNKWTVAGQSGTAKVGSHLTAIAYCAPGTAAPRAVSNKVALPGLAIRTAIATCPVGTIAIGGGFSSAGSLDHIEVLLQFEQGSDAGQFGVTMGNIMKTATTLTAYAYCAPGIAPTVVEKTIKIAAHKGGVAHARCPSGTKLLFGGLDSKSASLAAFSFSASSTVQWDVVGYNVGGTASYLTSIAYCR